MVIQVIAILHCHIVYVWSYCVLLESLPCSYAGFFFRLDWYTGVLLGSCWRVCVLSGAWNLVALGF